MEMVLNGFKQKQQFLRDLQEKYGKNITLEEALKKMSETKLPISECTFTGIGVNNYRAYESTGEAEEFTGTILDAIEDFLRIDLDSIEDYIEDLIYVFCEENWTAFGYDENFDVKLVSVDREVTEDEVGNYLQGLQKDIDE